MASSSSSSSPEITHAQPNSVPEPYSFKYASQDDVLEDLSSRFILNLPDEELSSVERICFQVEQAHWYYEDFIREENPKFSSLPLKKFSAMLFNACPMLQRWSHDHEQAFNTFMSYKTRVPVCGAIMLNDKWDKCVLVKGWKSSSGWGFPKGKINQDEEPYKCAIREVYEETGYDLTNQIQQADFLELTIKEQRITLFIVAGIPESYEFQTRTRKEISKIEWFKLSDLPTWKRSKQVPGKFYLISPFVPLLKEFIRVNKPARRRQNKHRNESNSADLSSQIDLEQDIEDQTANIVATSYTAIRLDHSARGSSSSSADNGEPQTPSPQSVEAFAVTTDDEEATNDTNEKPLDPHFANLLSRLSMSSIKSQTQKPEKEETTLDHVTPTLPHKTLKKSIVSEEKSPVPLPPEPSGARAVCAVNGSLTSIVSNNSSVSTLALSSPSNPASSIRPERAETSPLHTTHRHMKHLALLESVANESFQRIPSPNPARVTVGNSVNLLNLRPPIHPGSSASVPPLPSSMMHSRPFSVVHPMSGEHLSFFPPLPNQQGFPVDDPFVVRQAPGSQVPPSSPTRRMSAHQGSLLSTILGSSNGPGPVMQQRFAGSVPPMRPLHLHPPPPPAFHLQQSPPRANVHPSQPMRIVPPPPSAFHLSPGPLTAPLTMPPPLPSQPLMAGVPPSHRTNGQISLNGPALANPNINANANVNAFTNRAQLLSLLNNGNNNAGPNLNADPSRPNHTT